MLFYVFGYCITLYLAIQPTIVPTNIPTRGQAKTGRGNFEATVWNGRGDWVGWLPSCCGVRKSGCQPMFILVFCHWPGFTHSFVMYIRLYFQVTGVTHSFVMYTRLYFQVTGFTLCNALCYVHCTCISDIIVPYIVEYTPRFVLKPTFVLTPRLRRKFEIYAQVRIYAHPFCIRRAMHQISTLPVIQSASLFYKINPRRSNAALETASWSRSQANLVCGVETQTYVLVLFKVSLFHYFILIIVNILFVFHFLEIIYFVCFIIKRR